MSVQPQDLDYAERAPTIAEGSAVVEATPAEVWRVLVDHESVPEWFPGVHAVRSTSDPSTGVGATRQVEVGTRLGSARFDERFIAWEEERMWAFTAVAVKPNLVRALVERATVEALDPRRTRVTYRMAFEALPAVRPMVPVLRRTLPLTLRRAMTNLGRRAVELR